MFDDQQTSSAKTPRGGSTIEISTVGNYSVFIPKHFQPKSKTIVILTPDNTTARAFARSETGLDWIKLSNATNKFAVVFAEPKDGGTWNTALSNGTGKRDERAFIYDLFAAIRSKSRKDGKAFLSVDKNGVTLLGYNEGASMAAVLAASWPAMFANTILVDPTELNASVATVLEEGSYPYIIDGTKGFGELKNKEIAMPLYVYASGNSTVARDIVQKWKDINGSATNKNDNTFDAGLAIAKTIFSDDEQSLFEYATNNGRFMGYPGGTIRSTYDYSDPKFSTYEESLGGKVRRWRVYTPSSYTGTDKVPLVVLLHGSSSAITDITEESRWVDIAEDEGFVLLMLQGYPKGSSTSEPIPSWNYSGLVLAENEDLSFIKTVVDRLLSSMSIDKTKTYLTGHSLGSMMTTCVAASEISNLFAAYAPVGMLFPTTQYATGFSNDIKVPTWAFLGQYDMQGSDFTKGGGQAAITWAVKNGIDGASEPTPENEAGFPVPTKYSTYTFSKDSVPLVKYTVVKQSPHVYMAEEAQLIWNKFFSHYSRNTSTNVISYI